MEQKKQTFKSTRHYQLSTAVQNTWPSVCLCDWVSVNLASRNNNSSSSVHVCISWWANHPLLWPHFINLFAVCLCVCFFLFVLFQHTHSLLFFNGHGAATKHLTGDQQQQQCRLHCSFIICPQTVATENQLCSSANLPREIISSSVAAPLTHTYTSQCFMQWSFSAQQSCLPFKKRKGKLTD